MPQGRDRIEVTKLHAGDIGVVAKLKNSHTNDTITTQNASFLDQTIGIYPSIDFAAKIQVKEVYGELLIPIIEDSFIDSFSLELGGRISDYNTTGTSYTYKLLGDLAVTDWLRFRGGYNRAERSPNIAELFLTPQQTFAFNAIGDICSQRSNYFVSANPILGCGMSVADLLPQIAGLQRLHGLLGEAGGERPILVLVHGLEHVLFGSDPDRATRPPRRPARPARPDI